MVLHHCLHGEDMKTFDPYNDRLARNLRNALSTAFVDELTFVVNQKLPRVWRRRRVTT